MRPVQVVLCALSVGVLSSCTANSMGAGAPGSSQPRAVSGPTASSAAPAPSPSPRPTRQQRRHHYFAQLTPVRDGRGSSLLVVSDVSGAAHQRIRERVSLIRPERGMHAIRLPTAAIHLPVLTAEAVNAEHLWIVTDECATTGARLWHTSDGGRHWQRHRIRGTNCAAGSTDNLAFTDARHGLLTVIVANAPGADLYRTGDGGRHWQHVASMNGDDRAALPIDGAVEQAGDGSLWLAGATCSSRLWKSAGVGDKWQKLDLPGVRGPKYLAPSVLDSVIVQPVSTVRTCSSNRPQRLNIFRSSDTGQHWRRLPVHLPVRARAARKARVDLTATSATHFWLTDHTNQGDRLFESRDAGKGWRTINLSALSNNRSGED